MQKSNKMKKIAFFLFLILTNLIDLSCFGQNQIDVTYIANAGFLIESNDKKVLIDALFKNGWDNYLIPADSIVSKIVHQEAPFDKVRLMLITHNHGDHFNASMVAAYLNSNPGNVLIAPPLVAKEVLMIPDVKISRNQIIELDLISRVVNDTIINGIRVKSFLLQHDTRPEIENVGYLVEMNGFKVFHTGDCTGSKITEFEKLQLQNEQIDLALLNFYGFWNTKEERNFTEEFIHPRKIALFHIPPTEIVIVKKSMEQIHDFPDITVFESSMKKRSFIGEK